MSEEPASALLAAELDGLLHTRALGRAARFVARCGSTSDEAAAWARAGAPAGAIVVADEQTAGRGRLGRRWHSPPGESLYLSLVLRPRIEPTRAPPLTLMAGVALAELCEELGGAPELKWPNDVLLGGRKVAGVLTEMATSGAGIEQVVLGVGLNLTGRDFPPEIAGRATSLALALPGARIERLPVLAALLDGLEGWYDRFLGGQLAEVLAAWRRRAWLFGQPIEVASGAERITGIAEALDDDGALVVRTADGRAARVVAGEIAWPAV